MTLKRILLPVLIVIFSLILASLFVVKTTPQGPDSPLPSQPRSDVVCTLDAKICPDGSAVGRTGPNCEFAACPGN